MLDAVRHLRALQDGVVSRDQLLSVGATDNDIERWLRRRLLSRVHPGVYVDHTGPPSWQQRAWAAVLSVAPAALAGRSAMRAVHGPGRQGGDDDGPIHVVVDHARRVDAPPGVIAKRRRDLDAVAVWQARPPRINIEDAVLDIASTAGDDHEAIAVLADAVQARLTRVAWLLASLGSRARVARREFLVEVLGDVEAGACSVLERRFLRDVEHAHGLPGAERQAPTGTGRRGFRDVTYTAFSLVVELDGRLGHTRHDDQDADLERDIDAALVLLLTVRMGWGQVIGRPCETSRKLARLLRARGWTGHWHPCTHCPTALAA